jgi:hypothetical protein
MARGGYRAGAGRKPGKKIITGIEPEEGKRIRDMLGLKTKAKAKIFNSLLAKIQSGQSITLAEKNLMDVLSIELAAEVDGECPVKLSGEVLTPLDYMLKVMNDPNEDNELRARMATAAAPYCHARKGEGAGKKEEKSDRAKSAGAGKFSTGRAPLAVVK